MRATQQAIDSRPVEECTGAPGVTRVRSGCLLRTTPGPTAVALLGSESLGHLERKLWCIKHLGTLFCLQPCLSVVADLSRTTVLAGEAYNRRPAKQSTFRAPKGCPRCHRGAILCHRSTLGAMVAET